MTSSFSPFFSHHFSCQYVLTFWLSHFYESTGQTRSYTLICFFGSWRCWIKMKEKHKMTVPKTTFVDIKRSGFKIKTCLIRKRYFTLFAFFIECVYTKSSLILLLKKFHCNEIEANKQKKKLEEK